MFDFLKLEKLNNKRLQLIIIASLTALVYVNSLSNKLVWDDHLFLEQWPQVQSLKNIGEMLQGSAPPAQGKIYRPLRGIFYIIDYQIWGANPIWYHFQAILIHLAVTLLVYLIAELITKKRITAFIISLLFGLHPIHTEAINYISTSMETFGSLFFFLSFYFYLKSQNLYLKSQSGGSRLVLYISSIVAALLAFFTYEMTLTLPLLIILYELCFHISSSRGELGAPSKRDRRSLELRLPPFDSLRSLRVNFLAMTKVAIPYFIGAGIFLIIRFSILGLVSRTDYLGYSFYLTMLTMVKVFIRYIGLLILPINQTAIHNLVGEFPSSMIPYDRLDPILNQTILDSEVVFALVVLVVLLLVAVKYIKEYPLITFGIGWFFISLLPVSYIIPHGGAMAEKYLYIPSFGFILLATDLLFKLHQLVKTSGNYWLGKSLVYIMILFVLFYGILTITRNTVWRDDISLFLSVVKKSPNNLLANYNLGIWYGNYNQLDKAAASYLTAIAKAPNFWEARFNLANIYLRGGQFDLAASEYDNVLKINPDFVPAKNTLNNFSLIKGSSDSAKLISDQVFVGYSIKNGLKFNFPIQWAIETTENGVILSGAKNQFKVEITEDRFDPNSTVDDYLKHQTNSYGGLINQGLAQVPNFDPAYVKIFNDKGVIKLQFFLFAPQKTGSFTTNQKSLKEISKVVKILVFPGDSSLMSDFNQILASIEIL